MAAPGVTYRLAQRLVPLLSTVRCHFASKCIFSTSGEGGGFEELSKRDYWDARYRVQEREGMFDWFLSDDVASSLVCYGLLNFAANKDFKEPFVNMHKRQVPISVLDMGCGLSVVPLRFYEWTPFPVEIHCLDYSPVAVNFQLKTLKSTQPGHRLSSMCGVCGNVCYLPYKDSLFHLVIDKGTMDALMKDPENGGANAHLMLHEADRVLQKGGLYLQVTDEDPDSRMPFLEMHSPKSCSWNVSALADNGHDDKECFVYSFSKA